MKKLSVPKCKIIKTYAFYDAYALEKLEAPSLETLENYVFLYASSKISSFKTIDGNEQVDDYLELPNCKTIGSRVFAGNDHHHIQTKIIKLPMCSRMIYDALRGSRITTLEAPNLANRSTVLSYVNISI